MSSVEGQKNFQSFKTLSEDTVTNTIILSCEYQAITKEKTIIHSQTSSNIEAAISDNRNAKTTANCLLFLCGCC